MTENIRIDFDPRIWGPKEWFMLETIVRSLPSDLSPSLEQTVKNHLLSTSKLLPCSICRSHMEDYINITKMSELNFSKRATIVKWINDLHNLRRPNNPRTIEQVDKYYKIQYDKFNTNYTDLLVIFITIVVLSLLIKHLIK